MSNIRITFFQLLQVAVGNREELSSTPTDTEWEALYSLCKEHAVLGIGYAGVERLPKEQQPGTEMMSMWQWVAQTIRAKNVDVNCKCEKVYKRLTKEGFGVCVLKGQSNLPYYPESLRYLRNSGDIDIWMWYLDKSVKNPIRGIIEFCGGDRKKNAIIYHHVDMQPIGNTEIEAHFRLNKLSSPLKNHRLQRWSIMHRDTSLVHLDADIDGKNVSACFPVGTLYFNLIYQLVHIFRHLYEAGIGIRQLIDYYFVLREYYLLSVNGKAEAVGESRRESVARTRGDSVARTRVESGVESQEMTSLPSRSSVMETLRGFGLEKFAEAVMYVLREAFDMPDAMLLCPVDEVRGSILLEEIMAAGNFGCANGAADAHNHASHLQRYWYKVRRSLQLGRYYPHESLWLPWFTIWHFFWRRLRLWRY